jgi:hypothetical protein
MKPKKSLTSRYANPMNSTNGYYSIGSTGSYGIITTSGSSTSTTIGTSSTSAGYVWAPYISSATYATYTYTPPIVEIEVLGKKFEITEDTFQQMYLAQIDFLGIGIYKSLKKNGVKIVDKDVSEYLEVILQLEERDCKILKILKNL